MPSLDGLRGLAILVVIFHNVGLAGHWDSDGAVVKVLELLSDSGWVGVQLFFVLSGFLITGILLDSQGASHQLRNFYMRRVLRIFPLYYAALAILFLVLPLFNAAPNLFAQDRQHQWWFWLYLINWGSPYISDLDLGHLWSLAIEEQFYLFWPLFVVRARPRTLVYGCLALIVSAACFRAGLYAYDPEFAAKAGYSFSCARWDALAIGALLAVIVRDPVWLERIRQRGVAILAVLTVVMALGIYLHRGFPAIGAGLGTLNQTTIALLFGGLILSVILPENQPSRLLPRLSSNSLLRLVGKYSYAIYIFHIPVKHVWFLTLALDQSAYHRWQLLGAWVYNCFGVFIVSFVLALLSWKILEQPFLRLKRFFSNSPAQVG